MKDIEMTKWYNMNDKSILMISDHYNGSPLIMCKYDVLLCSRATFQKYKKEILPDHEMRRGWKPQIKFM